MGCNRRCGTERRRDRGRRKKLIEALRWQHRWGAWIEGWQKLYDNGREPGRPFYERPEIQAHLNMHWLAFEDLTTERQIGMGLGPIPVSKIKSYAVDELELSGDEYERFFAIIRRMDDEYLVLKNSSGDKTNSGREVAMDDVDGTRELFRNMVTRDKNKADKKSGLRRS